MNTQTIKGSKTTEAIFDMLDKATPERKITHIVRTTYTNGDFDDITFSRLELAELYLAANTSISNYSIVAKVELLKA